MCLHVMIMQINELFVCSRLKTLVCFRAASQCTPFRERLYRKRPAQLHDFVIASLQDVILVATETFVEC